MDEPEDSPRSETLTKEQFAQHEQQAGKLFPTRDCQVELYHLHAMMRKLVLVDTIGITMVDPHDFLQVLSWRNLRVEEKQRFDLIHHLRLQLTRQGKNRKQILVPFHWDGHILLGYVDRSRVPGHQVRLFSPDSVWVNGARTRPGRHNPDCLLIDFMETVFPEDTQITSPPRIEKTIQGQIPLNPRLFIEQYRACFGDGKDKRFRQVLPIFFQALQFVSGIQLPSLGRFELEPMFLKRLVAVFSRNPFRNPQLITLRREADAKLKADFIKDINRRCDMARFAIATALRGGTGLPGEIIQAKWIARIQVLYSVECARDKALAFAEAHNHVTKLIESLCHKTRRKLAILTYATLETAALRSEGCWNSLDETWTDATALRNWEMEEFIDLQARFDWMKTELGLFEVAYRTAIANICAPGQSTK